MVSADALCVAPPTSSLLEHQRHQNSSFSDDAPPAAPSPPPRKSISNIREISSRYLSATTPPLRRTSSAYISSFSSVARRFPSPPKDRTLHQYQVPSYAIPPPSSSRRSSSSAERRRRTSSRDIAHALSSPFDAAAHSSKRFDHPQLRPSTRSSSEPCSPSLHISVKTRLHGRGGRLPIYLASEHSSKLSGSSGHRSSTLISSRQVLSDDRKRSPIRHRSFHQAENSSPPENLNRKQELLQYWLPSSSRLYGTSLSKSVDLGGRREGKAASALLQSKCLTPVSRVLCPTTPNFESFSQPINIEGPSSSVLRMTAHKVNLDTKLRSKEFPIKARQRAVTIHAPEKPIEPVHAELDDEGSQPAYAKTVSNVYRSRKTDGVATKATQIRASTPTGSTGEIMSRSRNIHDQALLKPGQGFIPSSPLSGIHQHAHEAFQRCLSPAKSPPSFLTKNCPGPRSSTLSSPASDLSGSRSMGAAASMPTSGAHRQKGKKGLTQGEAAFLYRTLHNRYLQWRFVNAQADLLSNMQKLTGEKLLYSVWVKTTELQQSLTAKRLKLQQARHAYKLSSILRSQGSKLQDWLNIHHFHSDAICGIVGALDAAMLRLPVNGGVKADSWAVREAIASSVDVMHAVEYSATTLIQRIQKANRLVSELARMVDEERALMEECSYLLLQMFSLEVQECSLRMHLIQSRRERERVLGHLMESNGISVG